MQLRRMANLKTRKRCEKWNTLGLAIQEKSRQLRRLTDWLRRAWYRRANILKFYQSHWSYKWEDGWWVALSFSIEIAWKRLNIRNKETVLISEDEAFNAANPHTRGELRVWNSYGVHVRHSRRLCAMLHRRLAANIVAGLEQQNNLPPMQST